MDFVEDSVRFIGRPRYPIEHRTALRRARAMKFQRFFLLLILMGLTFSRANAKETFAGDLNFDGRVTTADVVLALRGSLGLTTLDASLKEAADVSPSPGVGSRMGFRYGDGQVNVSDVTRMLRASVGLDPLGANWLPPQIGWAGPYLVLNAGDALEPGGAVMMNFAWEGPGTPAWTISPSDAASVWRMQDARSALLEARSSEGPAEFTVTATVAPYEAVRLGAIRSFGSAPDVTVKVATNKVDYPPLEPPKITVTAHNNADHGVTTDAGIFLVAFDNETHQQIWETRDAEWSQKVELAANETRTWDFTWNWKDLNGVFVQPRPYTLFARLGISSPATFFSKGAVITRIAVE
jgi:hypothetical protein